MRCATGWRMMLPDRLFKLHLYRGVVVRSPPDLIIYKLVFPNSVLSRTYLMELNYDHELAAWLIHDCFGPWRMQVVKPHTYLRTAIAFARSADAMSFRILSADFYPINSYSK